MNKLKYRSWKNKFGVFIICFFSLLTAIPLFAIIIKVFVKGIRQINFDFFTKTTPDTFDAMLAVNNGEVIPGGVANGIVGTLLMVLMAAVVAVPPGILCGIYLSENKKGRFSSIVRFVSDILQGTPSIVIGIVVYAFIVVPMKGYSAVAGAISLAIMMLPLIVRSTEESLNMLPSSLKEAGLALGASYSSVVFKVLLPSAFGGIFTGILLAVSRVIGETAPLMLTALGSSMVQWNVLRPSSSISLLIWECYNDPNMQSMIWSASLFLLFVVLLLNFIAKRISLKLRM